MYADDMDQGMARLPRDNDQMEQAAHDITVDDITLLVDAFYSRVREDAVLGPIFNPAVHDWDEHQATLVKFWSSVVLGTREYRGNPMAAHRPHPIVAEHFQYWLALWQDTAQTCLGEDKARIFMGYARRIAQSLMYGLDLDPLRKPQNRPLAMHPGKAV